MNKLYFVALAMSVFLAVSAAKIRQEVLASQVCINVQPMVISNRQGIHIDPLDEASTIRQLRNAGVKGVTVSKHVHLDAQHPYDSPWDYASMAGGTLDSHDDVFMLLQGCNIGVTHRGKKGVGYLVDFSVHVEEAGAATLATEGPDKTVKQYSLKGDKHVCVVVVPAANGMFSVAMALGNTNRVLVSAIDVTEM